MKKTDQQRATKTLTIDYDALAILSAHMAKLGSKGGKATSAAKRKASKKNGLKGGDPRKKV
jgi:hypothetical protein